MSKLNQIKIQYTLQDYLLAFQEKVNTATKVRSVANSCNNSQLQRNFNTFKVGLTAYTPSLEMSRQVRNNFPMCVVILMEDWSDTAAMMVPYVVNILMQNPKSEVFIVPINDNLEFANLYFTDRTLDIPLVIGFSKSGEEQFVWGPMSEKQKIKMEEYKKLNLSNSAYFAKIRIWIATHNSLEIETDFKNIFARLAP